MYVKSFSSAMNASGQVYAGNLQYNTRRWLINGQSENVDPNYRADVGYVPRNGFRRALATVGYTFLPEGGHILSHGPLLNSSNFFDWSGHLTDYENDARLHGDFSKPGRDDRHGGCGLRSAALSLRSH